MDQKYDPRHIKLTPHADIDNILKNHSFYTQAGIRISFSKVGDTFMVHSPKMKMVEWLCYVGGTISMWLGLSVVGVSRHVIGIIFQWMVKARRYLKIKFGKIHHEDMVMEICKQKSGNDKA